MTMKPHCQLWGWGGINMVEIQISNYADPNLCLLRDRSAFLGLHFVRWQWLVDFIHANLMVGFHAKQKQVDQRQPPSLPQVNNSLVSLQQINNWVKYIFSPRKINIQFYKLNFNQNQYLICHTKHTLISKWSYHERLKIFYFKK